MKLQQWYLRRRSAKNLCMFEYSSIEIDPETTIEKDCNSSCYRQQKDDDFCVILYNPALTEKYWFCLSFMKGSKWRIESIFQKKLF